MRVSSIDESKRIANITVASQPTKLTYSIGDLFDPTGLSLTITYVDGTTATINSFEENEKEQYTITEDTTSISMYFYDNNQTIHLTIPITVRSEYLEAPLLYLNDLTMSVKKVEGATGYHIYENDVLIGNILSDGTWEDV